MPLAPLLQLSYLWIGQKDAKGSLEVSQLLQQLDQVHLLSEPTPGFEEILIFPAPTQTPTKQAPRWELGLEVLFACELVHSVKVITTATAVFQTIAFHLVRASVEVLDEEVFGVAITEHGDHALVEND